MAMSISGTGYGAFQNLRGAFGVVRDTQGNGPLQTVKEVATAATSNAAVPRADKVSLSQGGAGPSNGFEALQQTSKVVKNDPLSGGERPTARQLLDQQRNQASADPGGQLGSRINIMA